MNLAINFLKTLLCFEILYFTHSEGSEVNDAFNLYIHHGVKMKVHSNLEDSLFGFSLALKDESVFVGAPHYARKGGVFYCSLNDCEDECGCSAVENFDGRSK